MFVTLTIVIFSLIYLNTFDLDHIRFQTTSTHIEILTVEGHTRRELYVPSHLHLNVTYLLEADEDELLTIAPDENSDVNWFTLEEAVEASTEPWFKERIYSKLNNKLSK